jgi:hypothetical protein
MTDYDSIRDDDRADGHADETAKWRTRGRAFLRWLTKRPAESWLFFVGGVLAGKILL